MFDEALKVICVRKNGGWQFSISDNGIGIKEKDFNKIFKIFYTAYPFEEAKSCGIGLSIAKKAVENCGGKIWLESEVGVGTTFYFTVPTACSKLGENDEYKSPLG